jgi:hypothetical protein
MRSVRRNHDRRRDAAGHASLAAAADITGSHLMCPGFCGVGLLDCHAALEESACPGVSHRSSGARFLICSRPVAVAQIAHDLEVSGKTIYAWRRQEQVDSGRAPDRQQVASPRPRTPSPAGPGPLALRATPTPVSPPGSASAWPPSAATSTRRSNFWPHRHRIWPSRCTSPHARPTSSSTAPCSGSTESPPTARTTRVNTSDTG